MTVLRQPEVEERKQGRVSERADLSLENRLPINEDIQIFREHFPGVNFVFIDDPRTLHTFDEVMREVDGAKYYDQRFNIEARPDDYGVVNGSIDKAWLNHLNNLRMGIRHSNNLETRHDTKQPLAEIVLENPGLISRGAELLGGSDSPLMVREYMQTDAGRELTRRWREMLEGTVDVSYLGNGSSAVLDELSDKVKFKELYAESGEEVAEGVVVYKDQGRRAIGRTLREKLDEYGALFVREAYGAGGSGNKPITEPGHIDEAVDMIMNGESERALVERNYAEGEYEMKASPSVRILVTEDGPQRISYVTGQILKDGDHQGNYSPSGLEDDEDDEVLRKAKKIGEIIYEMGGRGIFGVDFMVGKSPTEKTYVIPAEINTRVTGANPLDSMTNHAIENHGYRPHIAMFNLHLDPAKHPRENWNFNYVHEQIENLGLDYTPMKGRGVLEGNIGPVGEGKFTPIIFAPSAEETMLFGNRMIDWAGDGDAREYFNRDVVYK